VIKLNKEICKGGPTFQLVILTCDTDSGEVEVDDMPLSAKLK